MGPRRAEAAAIEAVYALGRLGGIDVAVYGEYELGFRGADAIETKLLLQRRTGRWDLRLNLVAEKPLAAGAQALGLSTQPWLSIATGGRFSFDAGASGKTAPAWETPWSASNGVF